MNFTQWKSHAAKGAVSKITYVCGDQPVLVEQVVQDIKTILDVPVTDYVNVEPSTVVWELASQYSLDINANRLTVVRDAEKFDDWDGLEPWLKQSRGNPNNYLLFVSHQSDAPGIYVKAKKQYADYIDIIRTKGKLIKCSQPNDEDLTAWAMSYKLSQQTAQHLVQRTSGDTSLMYEVLRKVRVWNGSPNTKAIDLLCREQALDSFADYLILGQKQKAHLALESMSNADKAKIMSRLDNRLEILADISEYVRKRMFAGDIAATTGVKVFLVKKFMPVVKDYDSDKIRYCRQIMSIIDSAIQEGAKVGTIESLITLW